MENENYNDSNFTDSENPNSDLPCGHEETTQDIPESISSDSCETLYSVSNDASVLPSETVLHGGFADTSAAKPKRKLLWLKILCLVLGIAAIIAASSVLTCHLMKNSIISDKDFFSEIIPGIDNGDENDISDTDSGQTSIPAWDAGDGTSISINSAPTSSETLSLQEIYAKCLPSVVYIVSTSDSGTFSGTGIVLTENGYIVTNNHVIDGCSSAVVKLYDDTEYDAYLVGADAQTDLAVLKIDADGLTPAEFGDSSSLHVGDSVVAIGNPLSENFRGTMTDGIISAIDRNVNYNNHTMTLLQTNAAINSGNSGGPLINMYGQVIGITNMKMVSYYSSVEGIAFAIPSSSAADIINQLLDEGAVTGRPGIGIVAATVSKTMKDAQNCPDGVYVSSVYENTDAWSKGIQTGDIITEVNGQAVSDLDELNEIKNKYDVGDILTFTIYRDGEYFEVEVALCDMNDF